MIVLGSQIGGALAAALLAKRNHRVLLVEHDGIGPGYEHGGFVLPYAPFIAPPLKAMPAVEEAFTELGLTSTVQRALRPHLPELQLILPRHRVDLHADAARRRTELAREFGETAEGLLSALTATASQHEATDAFFKEQPAAARPTASSRRWGLKKQIKASTRAWRRTPRLAGDTPRRRPAARPAALPHLPGRAHLAPGAHPAAVPGAPGAPALPRRQRGPARDARPAPDRAGRRRARPREPGQLRRRGALLRRQHASPG